MATRTTRNGVTREILPSKITKETRSANRLSDIRYLERGGRMSRVEKEYEKSRRRKR